MSRTDTTAMGAGDVLQTPQPVRKYPQLEWEEEEKQEEAAPSVPFTLDYKTPEEILAFLSADPPTSSKPALNMERNKSISKLKNQLADLDLKSDEELFKSGNLNVGKYVVGPAPGSDPSSESNGSEADFEVEYLDDEDVEECGTGFCITDSRVGGVDEHAPEGMSNNAGNGADDHADDEPVLPATPQRPFNSRTNPRAPPNTPATKEPIWWENEFVAIKKSKLGGLGAFAAKDLKYGDKILEELPILRTNNWGICTEYEALSDEDKELFHTLHKYSINPRAHDIEKIRRANSFQLRKGIAIYSVTSRFNHACLPARNVHYAINDDDAKITLTAFKPIDKGTELTICYGGKPEQLLIGFGFRCQCGGCEGLTDDQAEEILKRWSGEANWTNKW